MSNLYSRESAPNQQHLWLVFDRLLRETNRSIQLLLRVIPNRRCNVICNLNGLLNKSVILDSNKLFPRSKDRDGKHICIDNYNHEEHKDVIKYYDLMSIDFNGFQFLGKKWEWSKAISEMLEHAYHHFGDVVISEHIFGKNCFASRHDDVGDISYSGRAVCHHINLLKRICFITNDDMIVQLYYGQDRVDIIFNASKLNDDIEMIDDKELMRLKNSCQNPQ